MIIYAENELNLLNKKNDDIMQKNINDNILEVLKVIEDQGHSGFSINYLMDKVNRLIKGKPLTPLTGEDSEWSVVDTFGNKQNKRCSSVFMNKDGVCTDIDYYSVSDNGGITWFTSGKFRKKISFPYMPPLNSRKIYIEYKKDPGPGLTSDDYDIITNDKERIKKLYERKRKEFDDAFKED